MRGISLVLTGYFYKYNIGLFLPSKLFSQKNHLKIKRLIELTNEICKDIAKIGNDINLRCIHSFGYIKEFEDQGKRVAYLAIGRELNDLEYILPVIYNQLNKIGLERPHIEIFTYYHPSIEVILNDKKVRVTPEDESLRRQGNLGVKLNMKINIYGIDYDKIKVLLKSIIRQALWENAISVPSEVAVTGYTEKIFRQLNEKDRRNLIVGIDEMTTIVKDKIQMLNEKIENKFDKKLNEMEEKISLFNKI